MKSVFLSMALLSAGHPLAQVRDSENFLVQTHEIQDGGYRKTFEIALDEIYVWSPSSGSSAGLVQPWDGLAERLPLLSPLVYGGDQNLELVLYEKGSRRSIARRRILTSKVLVQLRSPDRAPALAKTLNSRAEKVWFAPGFFLFHASGLGGALPLAAALRRDAEVLLAEPLLGKQMSRKALPNDPLFSDQWHLRNDGQNGILAGIDMNLVNVWDTFRGQGIVVGVVDDGLEFTHPDLAVNTLTNQHHDYRDGDNDPSPGGNEDFHGTAVGGLIAGRGNNALGIAGVAYEASLVGIRLIGGARQTDEQNASAVLHQNALLHISNNSWGAPDDGETLDGPDTLMNLALEKAVKEGRGGKGTIFIWPSGNGAELLDFANYDGYANSIYTIAVGAVNDPGRKAPYSEFGSCLVICAPSNVASGSTAQGITTTDLTGNQGSNRSDVRGDLADRNYTSLFGGTSAPCAMVSGVVALMLQANPMLGWRDVQEILMRSAFQIDSTDPGWFVNGAGLRFNHLYGAGSVNAAKAVNLALTWTNLAARSRLSREALELSQIIPDNDTNGITRTFEFGAAEALRVEHVTVALTAEHTRRGDLVMTLISPSGTQSRLAERRRDVNADYQGWKFSSVFHWGEISTGPWRIHLSDQRLNRPGLLKGLRLDLYGSPPEGERPPKLHFIGLVGRTFQMRLTGPAGYSYELQRSNDMMRWQTIQSGRLPQNGQTELSQETLPEQAAQYFRAHLTP